MEKKVKAKKNRKWEREHYTAIRYDERNEIVAAFKEKCKKEGVPQASILRKAVLDFLNGEGDEK